MPGRQISLKISIVLLVIVTVIFVTITSIAALLVVNAKLAREQAEREFRGVTERAIHHLADLLTGAERLASMTALAPVLPVNDISVRAHDDFGALIDLYPIMDLYPHAYALYAGWRDGRFEMIINARDTKAILAAHDAPDGTWIIHRAIAPTPQGWIQRWRFIARDGTALGSTTDPTPGYDPRARPWYQAAINNRSAQLSAPYVFDSLQQPGLTVSRTRPDGQAVIGVDLTLQGLQAFVAGERVSNRTTMVLMDSMQRVLAVAGPFAAPPPLATASNSLPPAIWQAIDRASAHAGETRAQHDRIARYTIWMALSGAAIHIATVAPFDDFTGPYGPMPTWILLIGLTTLVVAIPLAYAGARRLARTASALAEDAERVRAFDFSGPDIGPPPIKEFAALATSFGLMKGAIVARTNESMIARARLENIVAAGMAIAAEPNTDRMMATIVVSSRIITAAEGGTLYLLDGSKHLDFHVMQNEVLNIDASGIAGTPEAPPPIPLFMEDGTPNYRHVVSHAIHEGKPINIEDIDEDGHHGYVGTREFDRRLNYKTRSILTVPLRPRGHAVIGALQLINARNPESGVVGAFPQELLATVETLATQAANSLHAKRLADQKNELVSSLFQTVTELKTAQREASQAGDLKTRVARLERYDPLTDLPNRTFFQDLLQHEVTEASHHQQSVTLLRFDIDHFKDVNDVWGHHIGDRVLQQIAARVRADIGDQGTLARLGGDEFAVILRNAGPATEAADQAQRILNTLDAPFDIDDRSLTVGGSIGITTFPAEATSIEELQKQAELAMYQAKANGRRQYFFFSAALQQEAQDRRMLENDLRDAVNRELLDVYYQPKVSLRDGYRICGAEALLHWTHPDRGVIPPGRFIPIAESSGLIVPLGRWVLRHACQQVQRWRSAGLTIDHIAVNLSAVQFRDADVVGDVDDTLRETGLPPEALELEITESVVMDDVEETIRILRALTGLGVGMAIDDFGTGYSSLSYLRRFPVTKMKIDQSFVRDMLEDADARAITQAVISLGRGLNLTLVAEGIETIDQAETLAADQCDEGQGYYFSRPVAAADFEALLRDGNGRLPRP